MKKWLVFPALAALLFLSGCGSILMQPAVDEVKTVAIASVYMNKTFYNIKSPKADSGAAAFNTLLQATGKVVADKLDIHAEQDPLDEVDPEQMKIISYALMGYNEQLSSFGRWQMVPPEQVVSNDYYRSLQAKEEDSDSMAVNFLSAYLDESRKQKWVKPIGVEYIPVSSVIKDSNTKSYGDVEDPTEPGRKAMAQLCKELGVDAVGILQFDMGYRFNKLAKITLGSRTLAVPTISHQLVLVNKNGEIAVNTGAIVKGAGERYEGDTVGMVKGEEVILKHKAGKAVNSYNLALDKGAEGLRESLAKAFSKL